MQFAAMKLTDCPLLRDLIHKLLLSQVLSADISLILILFCLEAQKVLNDIRDSSVLRVTYPIEPLPVPSYHMVTPIIPLSLKVISVSQRIR